MAHAALAINLVTPVLLGVRDNLPNDRQNRSLFDERDGATRRHRGQAHRAANEASCLTVGGQNVLQLVDRRGKEKRVSSEDYCRERKQASNQTNKQKINSLKKQVDEIIAVRTRYR